MHPKNFRIILLILTLSATSAVKDYQNVALDLHDTLRADHLSPPLTLSDDLNKIAEKCADYYANEFQGIDGSCPYKTKDMGENLYANVGIDDTDEEVAKLAINKWYEELQYYRFSKTNKTFNDYSKTKHFTQLIWKSAKQMGFGIAFRNERSEYIVAVGLYTPPGNIDDDNDGRHYKENVLKPVEFSHGARFMKDEEFYGEGGGRGATELGRMMTILQMTCLAFAAKNLIGFDF
ncbi:unnamed protein product [Orchesella dallaii]|uniref:SCP domain-containing protein n=1 Tax=Orchesella dallaii TaxID=48710 RepID=A0ABP1RYN8_9HEXA